MIALSFRLQDKLQGESSNAQMEAGKALGTVAVTNDSAVIQALQALLQHEDCAG